MKIVIENYLIVSRPNKIPPEKPIVGKSNQKSKYKLTPLNNLCDSFAFLSLE
jgi:hypothetical protein